MPEDPEAARIRAEAIHRAKQAYMEAGLADAESGVAAALRSAGLDEPEVASPDVGALYEGVGDGDPMNDIFLPPIDPHHDVSGNPPVDQ